MLDTDNGYSEVALYTVPDRPYRMVSDGSGKIYTMMDNSGLVQVYNNTAEAGFIDVELRRQPDLSPIRDEDWIAVFLGRRPGNA